MADISLVQRLQAVLDALGIERAHVATQSTGDIAAFATEVPERIGGAVMVAPPRIDPAPFVSLAERVLYIAPSGGTLGRTARSVMAGLPAAKFDVLDGYDAESWDDIAADRPDLADAMIAHLRAIDLPTMKGDLPSSGEIEGVRYRIVGSGPALVLTPLSFAPSQWEPLLAMLTEQFRVVSLSGPHLGMLALLEQRAALAGWQQMCAGVFDGLQLSPGNTALEVGCGSGAVSRQFAQHTRGENPLTAIDFSGYFLDEARLSIDGTDTAKVVSFIEASAEQLPFEDNSFDAAYTITVLEECHAARALAELERVVRPGGRVAIVVRGIDLAQWWNLPVSAEVRTKIGVPAASVAANGVATASVYELCVDAGFKPIRLYPFTVASESIHGPVFEFPEAHAISLLTPDEQMEFRKAKAQAVAEGTIFMTRGHHCFIGEVPARATCCRQEGQQ